jgi:hypothetical protein
MLPGLREERIVCKWSVVVNDSHQKSEVMMSESKNENLVSKGDVLRLQKNGEWFEGREEKTKGRK